MPEQLTDDELAVVLRILRDNWESSNTDYSADPRFTTGWWDWAREEPTVTVTDSDVAPLGGGDTGYTHMDGDGNVGQRLNGTAMVNCWAGTYETDALAGEASGGGRLSPKILANQMKVEARRLLRRPDGTTDSNGDPQLSFVAPGRARRIVESDPEGEHPTLFRYAVTARFGYVETS